MADKKTIKIWDQFLELVKKKKTPKKDSLLIILLCGALLLVIAMPLSKDDSNMEEGTESGSGDALLSREDWQDGDYADYLEERLEDTLSRVSGVGKVKVMITLSSSAEKIIEKDRQTESENVTEEDSQGGVRTTARSSSDTATVYGDTDQSAGGTPYVTKELSPAVEGVVVIAEGGDQAVVIENITEAVQALFGVDTHKIKVMKLNQK